MPSVLFAWVGDLPILALGVIFLVSAYLAALVGSWLRTRRPPSRSEKEKEGYIVSAVLGLLALLMGFTFSLAIERFETRRELVIQDANAIESAYLRAQILGEPHRTRLSKLLIAYTDNAVNLSKLPHGEAGPLLVQDDKLLTDIWSAAVAAFDSIRGLTFSSAFIESVDRVFDLDASRRAAREAHVPYEVFDVLLIYLISTAAVLGYVLGSGRARITAAFLLVLLNMSLLLIIDIDRPVGGGVSESQQPLEDVSKALHSQPPGTFDRWRSPSP